MSAARDETETGTSINQSTATQSSERSSPSDDLPNAGIPFEPLPDSDVLEDSDKVLPSSERPAPLGNSADAMTAGCIEAASPWICDVEVEIAALVTIERQNHGVAPLVFDAKLSWTARQWSIEQAYRGRISHDWFQTGQLQILHQRKFDEDPRLSAENVALIPCSTTPKATAHGFISAWMNSSGHRANILRARQTRLGVGIVRTNGYCFGTQDFGH